MNVEHWQQIEALYRAARESGPEARTRLLAAVDPELRREVEALLAQEGGGNDRPPVPRADETIADSTVTVVNVGSHLGPYVVEAPLGAGGMGQVFRGRDTRLNRSVAIKVVDQKFSERFDREALAISALNHPHICTLYDVGPNYLVMELVQGDTLAARLKKSPLAMNQVLQCGAQIADALAAAHAKGIIHRDLKPGNIMLAKNGVKVLDFGLAKSQQDLTMTASNAVMGTPAYMAPEQMEGKEADARTDIYALGLVLYEMATGKRALPGQIPPIEKLPPQLGHLIERCLARDPDERWQSVADLKSELEWAGKSQPPAQQAAPLAASRPKWLWPAAAALFCAAAVAFGVVYFRTTPPAPDPVRFEIQPPQGVRFAPTFVFALSPDGRRLAYHAAGLDGSPRIWVRSLGSLDSRTLEGTNGTGMFWSPDSRFIGFSGGGKISKIDASGGQAQVVCEFPAGTNYRGGAWGGSGVIVFGTASTGLFRVSASGGVPSPITTLDASRQELFHGRPIFLPDGRHFLYVRYSSNADNAGVYAGSVDAQPEGQDRRRLVAGQYGVSYAPSPNPAVGYLLFMRGQTLVAQPFDARRLELTGEALPIADQVGNNGAIFGFFSASGNGSVAYRGAASASKLTWLDRQGKALGQVGEAAFYNKVALSPDGTRVARSDPAVLNPDLWLLELARGVTTRFTFAPSIEADPVWSPDGSRIAFASSRAGHYDLYQKVSNGAGDEELLLKSGEDKFPTSWSHDGRYLLYTLIAGKKNKGELWALPMEGDHKPFPFLQTEFDDDFGTFSPDGRWIAYQSDESGPSEIYARPFTRPGSGSSPAAGKWMVSSGGGFRPHWRGDGKELFYVGPDRKIMAVDISTDPTFQARVPQPMFPAPASNAGWDVTPDGKRFLVAMPATEGIQAPITVVLNWMSGLKH